MLGQEQGFIAGMNNAYMGLGNVVGSATVGILFDIHIALPYCVGSGNYFNELTVFSFWDWK